MQFDLFEDALAVGVVDDAQVAFVGRHDGEARGAVSVRGVTSGADPEPDGDPRASIAHEAEGCQPGPPQQPEQADIAQPLVALPDRKNQTSELTSLKHIQ